MVTALSALFGLAVGSFLNVVIYRFGGNQNTGGSLRLPVFSLLGGRSHCPHCHKTLAWYELVPVASFILQRRRCRGCGKLISWQYPLVEAGTALMFGLIAWQYMHGVLR